MAFCGNLRRMLALWRRGTAACLAGAGISLLFCSPLSSTPAEESNAPAKYSTAPNGSNHWAFQPLKKPASSLSLDSFIHQRLKEAKLTPAREADRPTLIRRVAFILTGLPPTPEEIEQFVADRKSGAYHRMVSHYLDSPRYGERWGKHWLDVAGYADSNGYFSADSDRPLAYRYRDYVIRALNRDKPFDQFVREQLAGDELSGWKAGQPASPEIVELLEATHFLRNGQDGSGESDGNPDEVRTDRYYALESAMQIVGSSLLGLTVQCAKCHDHKFEPLTQKDYYTFQAVLYPAFNIEQWTKPNDRVVFAHLPGELESWQAREKQLDQERATLRNEFSSWIASNRPPGRVLFQDTFASGVPLATNWAHIAPGDDAPAGNPPVTLDSGQAPAAQIKEGALQIIEGGGAGDRWLSTQTKFDWSPPQTGQWIQVTFNLVAARLDGKKGQGDKGAERFGYVIAAHDFDDSSPTAGGNVLIDGNPGGATSVHLDYPGKDSKSRGTIGGTAYEPGHTYGVRVTRTGTNELRLEHLVDGAIDGASLKLKPEELPSGAFAFEYCCGRSFVVDNVIVESSNDTQPGWTAAYAAYAGKLSEQKRKMEEQEKSIAARRSPRPGKLAWMTDRGAEPPEVHLLKRGNHKTPGDRVDPAFPEFLQTLQKKSPRLTPVPSATTTGRRLAWANWITETGSVQSALLARVTVNRVWQQYFGTGLAATPDNLGLSGAKPTHPELLDWMAAKFIESGWSLKFLHRLILESATFRQSSASRERAVARDPDNHWLWRYPVHRLDAEAVRDAMLAISGRLGSKTNGPYVPTPRTASGEVIVDESKPAAFSRSVFLQQRRTQVPTFLGTLDAPSIVFNCTRRASTTMPLQSLSLLNSTFSVKRGADLAKRLQQDCGAAAEDEAKIRRAFVLVTGREPDKFERNSARAFLSEQMAIYAAKSESKSETESELKTAPEERAWADFCQSLFGLNAFLYLE